MSRDQDGGGLYNSHWLAFPFLYAIRLANRWFAHFMAMRGRNKALVVGLLLFYIGLVITLFALGPKKVSHAIYDAAQGLRSLPGGWAILGSIMVATSVPPLIGFTTTTTLCGFVYGLKGYFIAGPATYMGSATAFVLLRMLFQKRIHAWAHDNTNWRALASVIRAKGLPLICLIRLCPLPWTGSNMLFAAIETVSFGQFMIATTAIQPKIFIAVFVGARLAKLSDGEEKDPTSVAINTVSIIIAVLVAVLTGVYVWRVTRAEIDKLEQIPVEDRHHAEEALEDLEADAPFVEPYRD